MPSAPAQTPVAPTVEIAPASPGDLTLKLGGDWKMSSGIPDPAPVFNALPPSSRGAVRFDSTQIKEWDSALLGYLLPIFRQLPERQWTADPAGLPEGVQKLLSLALAEPAKGAVRSADASEGHLTQMARITERAVEEVRADLGMLGEVTFAVGRLLRGRSQVRVRDLAVQLQECGAEALPIVVLIGFLVGAIIGFVGATVLETYGATIYTANMVAIAVARELGALMTAVILSGRTGAAFAANLGTMRTNEEIDALQTVGLDPVDYLVLPRVFGLCLMIPLLTAFADLAGITGGLLVATTMPNVTLDGYIHATLKSLTMTQVLIGLGKSVLFGGIIALVGCRRGLDCGRSAAAVGLAATSAVVVSITLVIALDGLLAVVFHALKI